MSKNSGFGCDLTLAVRTEAEERERRNAYMRAWTTKNAARLKIERKARAEANPGLYAKWRRNSFKKGAHLVGGNVIPFSWAKRLAVRVRARAKTQGRHSASITWEQLASAWMRQGGLCAWTGQPMTVTTRSPWTVSVDRRDNANGYHDHNVILTTWFANRARGKMDEATFAKCLKTLGVGAAIRIPIDGREVA